MKNLFSEASRSFLRAFIASLVVLIPGLLAAPNLAQAAALAWAASIASVIAGLKAIQVFVPQLSVGALITRVVGLSNRAFESIEDSFVRAFVGTFIALSFGVLAAHSLTELRSLATAAVVAAFAAGIRAVEGFFTEGESPIPEAGGSPYTTPNTGPTP